MDFFLFIASIVKPKHTSNDNNTALLYVKYKSNSSTLRGRSASIEDLANIDETSFDGDVEPYEWKRVSKLRRSLQVHKSSDTRR